MTARRLALLAALAAAPALAATPAASPAAPAEAAAVAGAPAAASAPPAPGYQSCQQRAGAPAAAVKVAAPAPHAPLPLAPTAAAVDPRDLEAFEASVRRFEEEGREFRVEVQQLLQRQYDGRRRALTDHYERSITALEGDERSERDAAIARFEKFLADYPDDAEYTPDAMFRLSELYFERSDDEFRQATELFREEARRAIAEGREPPPEPVRNYATSIALYQRILTGFPSYRFRHGIQYLLAYGLGEMGQAAEASAAYHHLIERYPQSPYVPEAWVRLGDAAFDDLQPDSLREAARAYAKLFAWPDHPLYARALYKLGWTYYRLDDYQAAVESFTRLLDHDVAVAQATGAKPGGDIWPEAIQYAAISFADEKWGGVARAKAFFDRLGARPYQGEIMARLGDVYFEQTRYPQAVEAYREAIRLDPLAAEAPRLHGRMVLAWSRDRRFDEEAAERRALTAAYAEGSPWWDANQGDPALQLQARELVETGLLRGAAFHHAQAQALQAGGKGEAAAGEFRLAAAAYGDYLARYPRAKQAHELGYAHADCLYNALDYAAAARAYARVRDDPSSDQYRVEAALAAVISWQAGIDQAERGGALPRRPLRLSRDRADAPPAPQPIAEAYQGLVRDSDAFLAAWPDHPKAATIAYKAGEAFYRHDDFAESRCRFDEVVARWPRSEEAGFAANLLIEGHLAAKDWKAVEDDAGRLQQKALGGPKGLQADLQKFKLGSRFNRAMQAMEAKRWEEGARLFTALVDEDPKHEFADKALFNAAACYEGARRFESALKLYERISADYPGSTLADEALFRVAFNAENTYDFDKAVDRYQALVERYPGSKHRKDALYNAARDLENLQRYQPAAEAFARYAHAYPDAEDAARTQFHAALIHEKTKDWRRVVGALQEFERRFGKTGEAELLVQAQLKIAQASHQLKDERAARAAYGAAVAEFQRRNLKPDAHPAAAAAAAEARFRLAEYEFEKYDAITLPATTDPNRLKKALAAKFAEAKRVAPLYDEVGAYKRPDWIIAAFYRKAYLLERLAQTIYEAPIPPEYKRPGQEEFLAAYQDGLAQFAQPYEEQAVGVYVQAIEAARKLHVKNEWTRRIGESLARYRPREYPVLKEAKSRLVEDDLAPVPLAGTPDGPARRPAPAAAQPAPAAAAQPPAAKLGEGTEK